MADLSDKNSSDNVKLVGSDTNGAETNYLAVDENQQALVKDAGAQEALASIDTKLSNPLAVTQSGEWVIDVNVPAPTGGATEAKQDTGNTSLSSIDGKLTTTANGLKVDNSTVTQPISASSLPLPTGAATESTLSTLSSKIPSNLTVTSSRLLTDNSGVTQPVSGTVTANAGTGTFAISASTLPLPTGAATSSNQTTGNTSLASIDGKLTTTANGLKIDGSAVTQNTIATNNLINVPYNQIVISAVNASNNPTTVLFKQSGTTVATLTIAYDAQGAVQSVTRS